LIDEAAKAGGQPGLVLVSYGGQGIVELGDGQRLDCKYRRSVGRPCCGDRVVVESADENSGVVREILARKNEFVRADSRQRKQVVASNLDRVLVVIAPHPEPSTDLVERYLVAVHSLGIEPVIVLNKAELMPGFEPQAGSPLTHLEDYRQLGYKVTDTSCKTRPGVDDLIPILQDATCILVGQSGVGKSSLVNRLIPDLDIQTNALSHSTGKGRHTTTTTIMYSLPDHSPAGKDKSGGRLIDSPGVWEYDLWDLDPHELEDGFIEFKPHLGQCRFNDCKHASEPQCAVKEAVAAGKIFQWRHDSYLRLLTQSTG
jgi:ribosome biogenesis GTPase